MSAPTRRSVVTGVSVLPAIPAAATSDDVKIERLWIERMRIVAETHAIARSERQLPKEDAVGITALEDQSDNLVSRLCEIDHAIEETAPSPTKAATLFMIRLVEGFLLDESLDKTDMGLFAQYLLPTLRPHLTGLIARHVDDLIRYPAKTYREREFCEA